MQLCNIQHACNPTSPKSEWYSPPPVGERPRKLEHQNISPKINLQNRRIVTSSGAMLPEAQPLGAEPLRVLWRRVPNIDLLRMDLGDQDPTMWKPWLRWSSQGDVGPPRMHLEVWSLRQVTYMFHRTNLRNKLDYGGLARLMWGWEEDGRRHPGWASRLWIMDHSQTVCVSAQSVTSLTECLSVWVIATSGYLNQLT